MLQSIAADETLNFKQSHVNQSYVQHFSHLEEYATCTTDALSNLDCSGSVGDDLSNAIAGVVQFATDACDSKIRRVLIYLILKVCGLFRYNNNVLMKQNI